MCTTCGCSDGAKASVTDMRTGETVALASAHTHHHHAHDHHHDHGHRHHDHDHGHQHRHHEHHEQAHTISLEWAVLQKNDALAERNRSWFAGREILALNLVSSPGAGKTSLLERTIADCRERFAFAVVEGDQATLRDGERIRATGAKAVQVNTGTGCHLEAGMVARGLKSLKPEVGSILLIENVGNLVCPALFDLGERAKVAILSVTEGEDKPIKYPHIFQASDLMLLNKVDLLPHLDFDVEQAIAYARQVNPDIRVLQVSARTGEGMAAWYDWLAAEREAVGALAFESLEEAPSEPTHP